MLTERQARLRTRTLGWGSAVILTSVLLASKSTTATFYLILMLPWITAVVYRWAEGAIHLVVSKRDRRPNVTVVYMFAILTPVAWMLDTPTPPLRWEFLAFIGIVVGSLLTAAFVRDPRTWLRMDLLAVLAANMAYGTGVTAALNQDMDSRAPEMHTAQVLGRRTSPYRGHAEYLKLGPWGPRENAEEVRIRGVGFDGVAIGESVCIDLHPGALWVSWYETYNCGPTGR